ncbi:autotransporter outer membrane beta-barrel domain-containing protein [Pontiellaceae bacterium B12219]|nr:autotransporter outer membrane beta-barrel domain-containing protein [Pontiellaceae bacterium B12219]
MKIRKIHHTVRLTFSAILTTLALSSPAQDLIYNSPTGSVNTINSSTNASRLFVGVDEANNQLLLDNGAMVTIDLLADVGQQSSATNSQLMVSNGGKMVVGNADTGNLPASGILVGDTTRTAELNVDHESRIVTDSLYLGVGSNETGRVSAQNGGVVEVIGDVIVGAIDSQNNVLDLQNDGALLIENAANLQIVNNSAATDQFNEVVVGAGSSLLVKGDLHAPDLITKDGLNFESGATLGIGGELTTVDNAINNGLNILLDDSLSTNHTAHWNASSIDVGTASDNNSLTIKNGAQVNSTGFVYVGNKSSATDNSIIISGTNSSFTAQQKVFIGANGSRNALEILEGGSATVNADIKLGSSDEADNNALTVDGTNSMLVVNADAFIGVSGEDNTLTVSDTAETHISGNLHVGQKEDDNRVTVDNGTLTVGATTTLGSDGEENALVVKGSNGVFNATDLIVGDQGDDNYLQVSTGAQVDLSGSLSIGNEGDDNYVQLNDSNTTLRVGSDITVGNRGNENEIKIYGGTLYADANVYLGTTNNPSEENSITISGSEAELVVADHLFIGSDISSNNTVTVSNGGLLEISAQTNVVFGASTNNTLTIANEGILKTTDWDMSMIDSNLTLSAGAGLHLTGLFSGTNAIDGELKITLDGTSASWDSTNLYVGRDSDNNSLTLTNGATATVQNDLYIGLDSGYNELTVASTGSTLNVGMDLSVGSVSNSSSYNTLTVIEGGEVFVGQDMNLFRRATLDIDSKSQVTVDGDYTQDQYSSLKIGISSNQVNPNLVVDGTAAFASSDDKNQNSIIEIYDEGIGESNVIRIVQAKELTLDGNRATGALFEDNIATNSLLGFTVAITNDASYSYIVLGEFIKRSIADAGGLTGQLQGVANSIELLQQAGDSNAVEMVRIIQGMQPAQINTAMNDYYGEKESSIPANNVIYRGIQNVADQVSVRADNTRARKGMASSASDLQMPQAVNGPHAPGQELQGWVSAYGSKGTMDATDGYRGYDASQSGFLIGLDAALNDNWLIGLAGGSGSSTIDQGNASTDIKTLYGSGYASVGTEDWFADMGLVYGDSDVDARLGNAFDTTAEYRAQTLSFFAGGGKEITRDYVIFTPELSFLGTYYFQENYQEEASNAVGRKVRSLETFNLQSSLGTSMAMYMGLGKITFKPEISAYWLHEWIGDEEEILYSLQGANGTYALDFQAPEKDILKLGIGSSAKWGEYLELRADLDGRFGSDYSDYTLLGSVRYQF